MNRANPAAAAAEPVTLTAADGRELHGLLVRALRVEPQQSAVDQNGSRAAPTPPRMRSADVAKGAFVISGGVGFPREFYLKFANYAAQRGYHALVYDYRGTGASCREPLRNEDVRLLDWGVLDIPAAFQWVRERFPELPLFTVGHSIGGQFLGLTPSAAAARAHVMIATSFAYWRWEHAPFRYNALFFWKVFGPLMIRLRGFVPQGRVWTGLSLPRGVFEQWRTWGLRDSHFVPDLSTAQRENLFGALHGPVLAYLFEDDPIATRRSSSPLFALYRGADVEQRWIKPADIGAKRIGHQGFFSERFRESLWRPVLDWVDLRC